MDEMLDLFDAQGNPTGVTIRRGEAAPAGMCWAVVDVWIANSRGELLLQQRDASRPNWPLYWSKSAGGAVQSGEMADDAAIRETQEEIGITPDWSCGSKVFEFLSDHALHHVYLFCQDVPLDSLTLQESEVCAVQYADPATIRTMLREGHMVPSGYLAELLRMLPILTSMYRKAD